MWAIFFKTMNMSKCLDGMDLFCWVANILYVLHQVQIDNHLTPHNLKSHL